MNVKTLNQNKKRLSLSSDESRFTLKNQKQKTSVYFNGGPGAIWTVARKSIFTALQGKGCEYLAKIRYSNGATAVILDANGLPTNIEEIPAVVQPDYTTIVTTKLTDARNSLIARKISIKAFYTSNPNNAMSANEVQRKINETEVEFENLIANLEYKLKPTYVSEFNIEKNRSIDAEKVLNAHQASLVDILSTAVSSTVYEVCSNYVSQKMYMHAFWKLDKQYLNASTTESQITSINKVIDSMVFNGNDSIEDVINELELNFTLLSNLGENVTSSFKKSKLGNSVERGNNTEQYDFIVNSSLIEHSTWSYDQMKLALTGKQATIRQNEHAMRQVNLQSQVTVNLADAKAGKKKAKKARSLSAGNVKDFSEAICSCHQKGHTKNWSKCPTKLAKTAATQAGAATPGGGLPNVIPTTGQHSTSVSATG